VIIRGNIEASADLHVDGKVIGDIACASLVMGDASSVEGQIVAESARISGAVSGTIRVRELVVLRGASVEGDVSYETISIEQGAAVNGRFAPRSAGQAASPAISQTGASALIEDAEFIAAG
jgi:cytoskeletal protein CcmA (bactofilin family)